MSNYQNLTSTLKHHSNVNTRIESLNKTPMNQKNTLRTRNKFT